MPQFKTSYNILKKQDEDECFNPNWMNSDKLVLPPGGPDDIKNKWDYSRELKVEDVDIWEVLYEATQGIGLYASWKPYAEFYMITTGLNLRNAPRIVKGIRYWDRNSETFYGAGALNRATQRAIQLNIPVHINQIWVDSEDMWLYENPDKKLIFA
jgi:hypothetical protein